MIITEVVNSVFGFLCLQNTYGDGEGANEFLVHLIDSAVFQQDVINMRAQWNVLDPKYQ